MPRSKPRLILFYVAGFATATMLIGCRQSVEKPPEKLTKDQPQHTQAPLVVDYSCLSDLPKEAPERAAQKAVHRGDTRLFRYGQNGVVYQQVVAGYETCRGDGLAVPGHSLNLHPAPEWSEEDFDRDTIKLGPIRDRSKQLSCMDCDYPLTACGKRKVAYAARYNRELFRLKARRPRPYCIEEDPTITRSHKK